MRTLKKGECPPTVAEAHESWLAECEDLSPAIPSVKTRRTRFDDADKPAARRALVREQGGLCAFCLGRIWAPPDPGSPPLPGRYVPRPDDPVTSIAHVIPLSVDHLRILDWSNLLGSCAGGTTAAPHCDRAQGHVPLAVNPALLTFGLEHFIAYTSAGALTYQGPAIGACTRDDIQREFDQVLNLNCTRLKENRAGVIEEARRKLPPSERQWTSRMLENAIEHWSRPGLNGYSPYFCVQVAYLMKKLRRSRA